MIRLILAATLSSNYVIYGPPFELYINKAISDKSEDILVTGYYEAGDMITKHLYPDGIADGPGGSDDFQTIYFNPDWKDLGYISFDSINKISIYISY